MFFVHTGFFHKGGYICFVVLKIVVLWYLHMKFNPVFRAQNKNYMLLLYNNNFNRNEGVCGSNFSRF